jgi:hypothetical protein
MQATFHESTCLMKGIYLQQLCQSQSQQKPVTLATSTVIAAGDGDKSVLLMAILFSAETVSSPGLYTSCSEPCTVRPRLACVTIHTCTAAAAQDQISSSHSVHHYAHLLYLPCMLNFSNIYPLIHHNLGNPYMDIACVKQADQWEIRADQACKPSRYTS